MDGTPALHPYILPPTPTEILAPINALNERVGQAATSMGLQRQQQQFAERTRQAQDEFLQAQAQRAHQSAAQLMKMHNDMFMQSRAAGFAQKGDVDNQKDNNAAEAQLRAMGFTVPSYPDGATTNQKHTILSDALNKAQNQMVGTLGTLDAKAQAAQQKIRQVMSDPAVAQQVNTAFKGLQAQMEAKNQQVMDNAGGPGTYAKFLQFINNPAMLAKQPGNTTQEKIQGIGLQYGLDFQAQQDAATSQAQSFVFQKSPEVLDAINTLKDSRTQMNQMRTRFPGVASAYDNLAMNVHNAVASAAPAHAAAVETKYGLPQGALGPIMPKPIAAPSAADPAGSVQAPPLPSQAPGVDATGQPLKTYDPSMASLIPSSFLNQPAPAVNAQPPLTPPAVQPSDASIAAGIAKDNLDRVNALRVLHGMPAIVPTAQSPTNAAAVLSPGAMMFGTNGVPPVSAAQILGGVNASIPPVQVTPYQQPVQTQAPQENSEYMDRMMFEQQNPLMMPNMGQ